MTQDEIEAEIAQLEVPSAEMLKTGGELFAAATEAMKAQKVAVRWLANEWVQSTIIATQSKDDPSMQAYMMLNLHGLAFVMVEAGFPDALRFLDHATEVTSTYNRLHLLETMLAQLKEKPESPLH